MIILIIETERSPKPPYDEPYIYCICYVMCFITVAIKKKVFIQQQDIFCNYYHNVNDYCSNRTETVFIQLRHNIL